MESEHRLTTPSRSSSAQDKRIPEIDSLRGIAAFVVMIYHYTWRYHQLYSHTDPLWYTQREHTFGIPMFFMLSAYMICLVLDRTKKPIDFIYSRISRLYPTFLFCMLVNYAITTLSHLPKRQVSFYAMLYNFTMIPTFLHSKWVDGAYWTLSHQVAFYTFAFAFLLLGQVRRIEFLALFFLVIVWGWHYFKQALGLELSNRLQIMLLVEYAHFFGAGLVLYCLRKRITPFRMSLFIVCLITPYFITQASTAKTHILGMILFLLGGTGCLPFLRIRPLLFLGHISFPFYLLHQNIGFAIIRYLTLGLGINSNIAIFTAIASIIAMATLTSFYIEQPSIAWCRALYYKKIRPRIYPEQKQIENVQEPRLTANA